MRTGLVLRWDKSFVIESNFVSFVRKPQISVTIVNVARLVVEESKFGVGGKGGRKSSICLTAIGDSACMKGTLVTLHLGLPA